MIKYRACVIRAGTRLRREYEVSPMAAACPLKRRPGGGSCGCKPLRCLSRTSTRPRSPVAAGQHQVGVPVATALASGRPGRAVVQVPDVAVCRLDKRQLSWLRAALDLPRPARERALTGPIHWQAIGFHALTLPGTPSPAPPLKIRSNPRRTQLRPRHRTATGRRSSSVPSACPAGA